jgi:UPF0288 family protein (methanogenesis marker protein 3)
VSQYEVTVVGEGEQSAVVVCVVLQDALNAARMEFLQGATSVIIRDTTKPLKRSIGTKP